MERYSEYKDSGVQWLGEIPRHWICTSLGRVLSEKLQYGASESGDLECTNDSMRYIRITDITIDGKLKPDGCKFLSSEIGKNYPVRKGDVLLARSGATVGKAFIYNEDDDACYAGYLIKASVQQEKVLPQFFFYFTQTSQYDEWKNRIFIQATIQNISAEKYARMSLCIPPLSEQHSIVSYLDDKCGKIDKMLEGKQKQIELLAEMKQRIIADAVTRGFNPNVKMKATNIPWLPEIPEHWEMDSLRRFLKIFTEKGHSDKQLLSVTREQGVIERNTKSKEENHNFIPEDLSGYKFVQAGDFVINKMKSWQGSYGVSEYEGIVSPAYFTCKLQGVDKDFFSTAIRSKIYVSFFARYSKGIRVDQWDLSPVALKTIPFALPPIDEQRAIVTHINLKVSKIETLTSKLQQEIESIKEYKQRLISDVVTGQIKVC